MRAPYLCYEGPGNAAAHILLRRFLGMWESAAQPKWLVYYGYKLFLISPHLVIGAGLLIAWETPLRIIVGAILLTSAPFMLRFLEMDQPRFDFSKGTPLPPIYYELKVVLSFEEEEIARDSGVIWFEDSNMQYQGFRTSFKLTPRDFSIQGSCIHLHKNGEELELQLEDFRTKLVSLDVAPTSLGHAVENWRKQWEAHALAEGA